VWLKEVLNTIIEREVVPEVLKMGDIVLVYKGGGKDPLRMDSYCGITLTSVIAKVLESLVLERMQDILKEAGIPHINHAVGIQEKDFLCRSYLCYTGDNWQVAI